MRIKCHIWRGPYRTAPAWAIIDGSTKPTNVEKCWSLNIHMRPYSFLPERSFVIELGCDMRQGGAIAITGCLRQTASLGAVQR